MRAEVIARFVDKYDELKQYEPGEVVDFDEERTKACEKNGLVKIIDEKPKAKEQQRNSKCGAVKRPVLWSNEKCLKR